MELMISYNNTNTSDHIIIRCVGIVITYHKFP